MCMKKFHIAIMKKSWGLTQKILSSEKTIESRWYLNRCKPWNDINPSDIVYFKDSGEPVKIQAEVEKVLQFENLTPEKVREILNQYAKADGLGTSKEDTDPYFEMFKNKKYCLLIFLINPKTIEPFEINKSGFGTMAAWITVNDLNKIKR